MSPDPKPEPERGAQAEKLAREAAAGLRQELGLDLQDHALSIIQRVIEPELSRLTRELEEARGARDEFGGRLTVRQEAWIKSERENASQAQRIAELLHVEEAAKWACGALAERVALDMDHANKDHSRWYRAVKRVRKALTPAQDAAPEKPPHECGWRHGNGRCVVCGAAPPASPAPESEERIYPCAKCGVMRSKAEGGTTFTVCDDCWNNNRVEEPGTEAQPASPLLSPAPCSKCGYNGEGYYQPDKHPCAKAHHAAERGEPAPERIVGPKGE